MKRGLFENVKKSVMKPARTACPQPVKKDLNKKSFPKQKTIQNFTIDAQGFRKTKNANQGQIGRHWLAGNSYFPCGRIFIFCFSEPLGINIEVLNSLLLWKGLFI